MDYKELFETGMSYETFMSIATAREIEKMENISKNVSICEEYIEKIKNFDKGYKFLLSAESWCPYVRATLPVLMKMIEINPNVEIKLITQGRGYKYLREKLDIDEDSYVVPTLVILDENFEFVTRYIGRPAKYKDIGFDNIKEEYFAGYRSDDIVEEILERMGKL